ncbi:DUF4123 domain-containing protein [Vreelandella titanicae]|uniref:DUF4123 domain-containing protein n=1 Tax=Vreelandella titanicae TaxID=664683 RepID=UPI00168175D7|nr:DUF4123 domain-containing protein [Halomonas titanicae]QNU62596.1 DUF4123 domain-containing protein [Halomonas titanicae]
MSNFTSEGLRQYSPGSPPKSSDVVNQPGYYVLLDALTRPSMERWLYETLEAPDYEVLYLKTPLKECREASPCLVALQGAHELWEAFLKQGANQEWGWLLYSRTSRQELLARLRWLLMVHHPTHGQQVLRLASPTVMHSLLNIQGGESYTHLLGNVIERAWLPINNTTSVTWWQLSQSNSLQEALAPNVTPSLILQEAHLTALAQVNWQRFQATLAKHLQRYFPSGPLISHHGSTMKAAEQVIATTTRLGFVGQRAHFYIANILGAHGDAALEVDQHPTLARLLLQPNHQAPMERLKAAVNLAQQALEKDDMV